MRFTAAKKAADPDRLLLLSSQPIEVGFENSLKTTSVFAVANKGFQFETQGLNLSLVVANFGNLGDPVVEEFKGRGVAEVQVAVSHELIKLSAEVIGTAR